MRNEILKINGLQIPVISLNTAIVGTGAAGYNAADSLYNLGVTDIAIITEGINMGTSRNTGSDKQTYYKLTLGGDAQDSVMEMAKTLFEGGSRHGDIALVEAALSSRCFFKLTELGVPFPHNRYGEYAGYKTDHDPRQRASSCGPLTSKLMTEALERQVNAKNIKIYDRQLVIGILTDCEKNKATGLVTIDMARLCEESHGLTVFNCTNIIYSTGGPAGMYAASVYPESQTGASGIAFEAGVKGVNLTESQYGIASIKFRWNLSGTYQQVIPAYISTDRDGNDEREFLNEYFSSPSIMLDDIFLKGYQWPFDPRKIAGEGSSLIDILVYNETNIKNRRVFMDFRRNPSCADKKGCFDFEMPGSECRQYLERSGAKQALPIERLLHMNEPAVRLYKEHGIDLSKEMLEIAVCAQHNNGGLLGNLWWESNLTHFFPVGEVNGTFGVYRPGGSALNSTQVGSLRAAQYIAAHYHDDAPAIDQFEKSTAEGVSNYADRIERILDGSGEDTGEALAAARRRMTENGAHIRSLDGADIAAEESLYALNKLDAGTLVSTNPAQLPDVMRLRDILITQFVYLKSIAEYIRMGGKSRGSYLIMDKNGSLPAKDIDERFLYTVDDGNLSSQICETNYNAKTQTTSFSWMPVRGIPQEDNWFETVWNAYMNGECFR